MAGVEIPITSWKSNDEENRKEEAKQWSKLLGRRPRLLVVEDDRGILEAVGDWFDLYGWKVEGATDGSAFFNLVESMISGRNEQRRFDAIITDISMPGLDVMAILEGLRVAECGLPIVVISALPDRNLPRRVQQLGRAKFFRKPFVLSKVHQAVGHLLMCTLDDRTIH